MRAYVVVAIGLLAMGSLARAESHVLFDGYVLKTYDRRVDVAKGRRVATILVGGDPDVTVDARAKKVTIKRSFDCTSEVEDVFTAAMLEARLVNYESLVLHRKQAWANAAKGFEKAVQLDPKWRIPAYNLASAHALLRANAPALAAIAPWLASEPFAAYVQVATDPELQPLLATPPLAAVRAAKPGTAAKLPAYDALYSPEKKLVAVYVPSEGYLRCSTPGHVALHDTTTGKLVAKISDAACRASKAVRASREALTLKVLVDLGFSPTPSERPYEEVKNEGRADEKRVGRFATGKLGVVTNKKGTVNVLRGGKFVAELPVRWGQYVQLTSLPAIDAIEVSSYTPSDICARTDVWVHVLPAARP